jgi:hypothetical protein
MHPQIALVMLQTLVGERLGVSAIILVSRRC